jgi:hypothetical protein
VRRLPLTLLIITAILTLTACGGPDRTSWQPSERPEGDELNIAVFVGGCDNFNSVTVRETDEDVTLQAYVDNNVKSSCDDMIRTEQHTVSLRAPLGDRPLLGCNPDDSVYFLPGGRSNENCESQGLYGR